MGHLLKGNLFRFIIICNLLLCQHNIIKLNNTIFSLAVEPVDKDVVKQGPRNVKTPMITKTLVLNVLFSASIIIVGTLWVFKREVS